jgi:hypothetical protein
MAGSMVPLSVLVFGKDFQMEVTHVLHSSRAMRKAGSRRGTVLIGNLIQGVASEGADLTIVFNTQADGRQVEDRIVMIEASRVTHRSITATSAIGIALGRTSMRALIGRNAVQAYDAEMARKRVERRSQVS